MKRVVIRLIVVVWLSALARGFGPLSAWERIFGRPRNSGQFPWRQGHKAVSTEAESRIHRGWQTEPHEFPWMVKIKVRELFKFYSKKLDEGKLINKREEQ